MSVSTQPLRYQISDWTQLPGALSNTSRSLHIHVTRFMDDSAFTGLRISVEHDKYGVVFATTVNPKGSIVANVDPKIEAELTVDQILSQLALFGFLITYKEYENLSGDQVTFLMTIEKLGFEKIRVLKIYHPEITSHEVSETAIVAFRIKENPGWLQASYMCSQSEFNKALNEGSAFNISTISEAKNYRWDWLVNFVADIHDVINDNAGTLQYDYYGKETAPWP